MNGHIGDSLPSSVSDRGGSLPSLVSTLIGFPHISHINHYACVFIILITSHISSYYIKWLADTWVPIFIIHYNICSINHSTVSQ